MELESLLKPVKWVDQQILREYSKITKKWEDCGKSRYSLSNIINASSFVLTGAIGNPYQLGYVHGWNFASDNISKPYGKDFNVQENHSRVDDGNPYIKIVDRIARLPLLSMGVGLTGFGLYEVIYGFRSGDKKVMSDGLIFISHGLPFIGVASCKYVKDADPKLLDKESALNRIYSWANKKLNSLTPQPTPQPVPVGNIQIKR